MGINIAVIGHVDHGKSTLIGRLLYDTKSIKKRAIENVEQITKEFNRRFEFAYFLDALKEEIEQARTIDTTQITFKSKDYYSVIDSPGHKEFLKNMFTGVSDADAAILVVSAEGIGEQTKRHLFLLKFLGLGCIFVCINKMDLFNYEEEIFNLRKAEIKKVLESLRFDCRDIFFIPVSSLYGDNVYKKSANIVWYTGPTLVEALDKYAGIKRKIELPLRFVVQDTYLVRRQTIVVGRIETGILRKNDRVVFLPSGLEDRVKSIRVFPNRIKRATRGEAIGVVLEKGRIARGEICGHIGSAPIAVRVFRGELFLFEDYLGCGDDITVRCGTDRSRGRIRQIIKKIDSETGENIESNPDKINPNEVALVDIHLVKPLVLEKYSEVPILGRFIIEKENKNVACGIVNNY